MSLAEDILNRYDYVEQSGVKGMRWGFRKERVTRADRKAAVTVDAARAKELKKQIRKKGISSVSNEDLTALNKRLQLESKYDKWAAENPSLKKKAATFIAKTIVQEATHEILGTGNPSPLGQLARGMQTQVRTQKGLPPVTKTPKHHLTKTPKPKGPKKPKP